MGRIAILTSEYEPFRGGIATFARELAAAAAELGHDVSVFAPDYLTECDTPSPKGVAIRRYHAGQYSARWYPAYVKAAYIASRGGYDQVLAADIAFLECSALAFGTTGQPFDAFVHGSELNRSRRSAKGRILAPFQIFRRPRRIFANSKFTRSLLLGNFPYVQPRQAVVALLGVGAEWFASADPESVRNRLNLRSERIIACVGRITPRKGQLTLLRALATPQLDRDGLCVVIAGQASARDEHFEAQLRALAENLKHAKLVFANDLANDEVRSLFAAADIFCLPGSSRTSAVEGFGLVFLEAAAQGAPAVASSVGGVPEVISHGETGLLVCADDPVALSSALASLLDDEDLRLRMGQAARSRAKEYSWRRCAEIIFGAPANAA